MGPDVSQPLVSQSVINTHTSYTDLIYSLFCYVRNEAPYKLSYHYLLLLSITKAVGWKCHLLLVLLHFHDIIILIHDNVGNAAIEASQDKISQRWSWRFSRLMLRVPALWGVAVQRSITVTEFVQTCVQSVAAATATSVTRQTINSLLKYQHQEWIQAWVEWAAAHTTDKSWGGSWLQEAVCLRYGGELSLKSLNFGPYFVWKWIKGFQLQGPSLPDPTWGTTNGPYLGLHPQPVGSALAMVHRPLANPGSAPDPHYTNLPNTHKLNF